MERFHVIEDAAAILASKGVYKQVRVYRRGRELYAAHGGGFIRLYDKGTSLPNIRVEDLDIGAPTETDHFGKLLLAGDA